MTPSWSAEGWMWCTSSWSQSLAKPAIKQAKPAIKQASLQHVPTNTYAPPSTGRPAHLFAVTSAFLATSAALAASASCAVRRMTLSDRVRLSDSREDLQAEGCRGPQRGRGAECRKGRPQGVAGGRLYGYGAVAVHRTLKLQAVPAVKASAYIFPHTFNVHIFHIMLQATRPCAWPRQQTRWP